MGGNGELCDRVGLGARSGGVGCVESGDPPKSPFLRGTLNEVDSPLSNGTLTLILPLFKGAGGI